MSDNIMTDMWAVYWKDTVIALFRCNLAAHHFASARVGAVVYPWSIPTQLLEFEE